jgi:hypothetical protein
MKSIIAHLCGKKEDALQYTLRVKAEEAHRQHLKWEEGVLQEDVRTSQQASFYSSKASTECQSAYEAISSAHYVIQRAKEAHDKVDEAIQRRIDEIPQYEAQKALSSNVERNRKIISSRERTRRNAAFQVGLTNHRKPEEDKS